MDIDSEDTFFEDEGDPDEKDALKKTESELLWVLHKMYPALDVLTELFRGRSPDYSPQTITYRLDFRPDSSFQQRLSKLEDTLNRPIEWDKKRNLVTVKEMETRYHSRCAGTFVQAVSDAILRLCPPGTSSRDTGIRFDMTGSEAIFSLYFANDTQEL
jgi:hypothetical protein